MKPIAEDPEERARQRQAIADRQNRMLAEAIEQCGGGADGYAYWRVIDRTGLEPNRITYCAKRSGKRWEPDAPEPEEEMPPGPWLSPVAAFGLDVKGEHHRINRYYREWSPLEEYHPLSDEQLTQRKEKRESAAQERQEREDRERHPLFFQQEQEQS